MIKKLDYNIGELKPYINWLYFHYAWGISGKRQEQEKLRAEAEEMLDEMEGSYKTHAIFGLFDSNSDGDDLILGTTRIPLLRQQHLASSPNKPNLCLSDFVRPLSSGIKDRAGAFATTVDEAMEHDFDDDPYKKMLAQTLADRLAEATAEKMHEDVRKRYWGYAPDENLSPAQLFKEQYQGIRPAIGYPSLPDSSLNFVLSDLIGMDKIGIRLTETGAMKPHASVSGLMISHPKSFYFNLGKIGKDQLNDYARRRGMTTESIRRFLAANL